MSIISLKRYLGGGGGESSIYRRVISLLVQGIALHAMEGDSVDRDHFQADLERIRSSVEQERPTEDLLVATGAVVQALQAYNQRTGRFLRQQSAELQNMISMLTQTVILVGNGSERSLTRLQDIEQQIERASVIEDVQRLKMRLSECLETVRDEAARQREESEAIVASMRRGIEESEQRIGGAPVPQQLDSSAALSGTAEAESAFREALARPGQKYVFVGVVARIGAINSRFGRAIGERVVEAFQEHMQNELASGDRLFRWTGPAIVALLEREEPIERVRAQIRKVAEMRVERTFELGGRSVLIPISAASLVIALAPPLAAVTRDIHAFVASQAPREN